MRTGKTTTGHGCLYNRSRVVLLGVSGFWTYSLPLAPFLPFRSRFFTFLSSFTNLRLTRPNTNTMSTVAGPIHVSSILKTMAMAPPSRDRHHAARQLAGLDPRQFVSNLQLAAANRSPHAISALKADMRELDDIFYKLSRAGYDVSTAQRDFQMLQAFVSQLASPSSASSVPEKHQQQRAHHHRTASVPSSSSPPSHSSMQSRPRSGSVTLDPHASTRGAPIASGSSSGSGSSRFAPGTSPSSTSSSSSSSSSSRQANATVLSPVPHRLQKPRRTSAPPVPVSSLKKVHFATHATVYTIAPQSRDYHAVVPPSRPACVPRVSGSFSADNRPRF